MPIYRSINIALHSQFDIEILPEYYPRPLPTPTFTVQDVEPAIPPLVDDSTSTCSVHIPTLPGSQFWIGYSVSPLVPEGHYFLFKLYIDGERVMSWSTGKEDGWRGKTMFGLFESKERDGGAGSQRGKVEKRVLCFSAPDKNGLVKSGCVEIRVHRASARKRMEREMEVLEETKFAGKPGGISLVNAGRAGPEQPKRFYKFALIDPIDQPFATFRYHYRTWEQLRDLGLLDDEYYAESEDNDMSVIEPNGSSTDDRSEQHPIPDKVNGRPIYRRRENGFQTDRGNISESDWDTEACWCEELHASNYLSKPASRPPSTEYSSPHRDSIASGTYVPRGAPASEVTKNSPPSLRHRGALDTYRLSMPPSIKLFAPESASRPLPVPEKHNFSASTAYRPHPAYPLEECTVRMPSPVGSGRDGITTPLMGRKGLVTRAGLMGVISSTWKRSTSGVQARTKSELNEGLRSVSF